MSTKFQIGVLIFLALVLFGSGYFVGLSHRPAPRVEYRDTTIYVPLPPVTGRTEATPVLVPPLEREGRVEAERRVDELLSQLTSVRDSIEVLRTELVEMSLPQVMEDSTTFGKLEVKYIPLERTFLWSFTPDSIKLDIPIQIRTELESRPWWSIPAAVLVGVLVGYTVYEVTH